MAKSLSAAEMRELAVLVEQLVWIDIGIAAHSAKSAIAAGEEVSDDLHRGLYKLLVDLSRPPLAPDVRKALMKVLGRSPRLTKGEKEAGAVTLQYLIGEEKARIKKNKERPREGPHEAALAEVARGQGMTVEALKKRIQRHRPRRKK
jgi:hypothetical protein